MQKISLPYFNETLEKDVFLHFDYDKKSFFGIITLINNNKVEVIVISSKIQIIPIS